VCQVKQGRFRVEEPPTDDYGMRTEVFEECVQRLKLVPTRDCFATQETKKSGRYYSSEDDALSFEWDPNEVLWINPPWTLWPQAVDKLLASSAPPCACCRRGTQGGSEEYSMQHPDAYTWKPGVDCLRE
jgi:hypothetical protein